MGAAEEAESAMAEVGGRMAGGGRGLVALRRRFSGARAGKKRRPGLNTPIERRDTDARVSERAQDVRGRGEGGGRRGEKARSMRMKMKRHQAAEEKVNSAIRNGQTATRRHKEMEEETRKRKRRRMRSEPDA